MNKHVTREQYDNALSQLSEGATPVSELNKIFKTIEDYLKQYEAEQAKSILYTAVVEYDSGIRLPSRAGDYSIGHKSDKGKVVWVEKRPNCE